MDHISVTIPVYNRAYLVGKTIESVLCQTYPDFDLLVVDDASTDDTVNIIKRYCQLDNRVHLEVNPINLGLVRNWNRCLSLATGPLIQILLSDDYIDKDYLEIVANKFLEFPSIGFCATACRYIDIDDQIILPGIPAEEKLYKAGDEAVTYFLTKSFPHMSSIVVKKSCYEKIGLFDDNIWHGPDVEMDARLGNKFDFILIGGTHTSFRRHGGNIGEINLLRPDYLKVDLQKKQMAWSYISDEGLKKLGIKNINKNLLSDAAKTAVNGAIIAMIYGRFSLSRQYLENAYKYHSHIIFNLRFWKALLLNLFPWFSKLILARKFKISKLDYQTANLFEKNTHKNKRYQ